MARATFYYNIKRIGQPDGYDGLRKEINRVYHKHHGRYGYRRITIELNNCGIAVNHKTVKKLMDQMELKAKRKKVAKYKSYKGEVGKVAPNVINRDFHADRPNQKWTTDVTEIKIKDRKTYLSPILDMYNGEIVTYVISDRPDMKMITTMLRQAFRKVNDTDGLIFHSDQGWQYQHRSYQKMLADKKIIQSMSRKGNCLDNSMMENFFGIMKTELLYLKQWDSLEQFNMELKKYIHYYNCDRIKLRLKGKSPVKYRTLSKLEQAS